MQGESYRFFYNPMWNYLGDQSSGPGGTYFHDSAPMINLFWYMFDQVLIRPELLGSLVNESIEIVTDVDGKNLLSNNGQPNKQFASDHLPILFTLHLTEDL